MLTLVTRARGAPDMNAEQATATQPDLFRRGLRLLEVLAGMEQPASLHAIADAVGLPKASTYRVLRSLQSDGYIDHSGRRGYRIGSRSLALASLIGPRPALLQRAHPLLMTLAAQAGHTATLHLRSGSHRVLVLSAAPAANPHRRDFDAGERAPLTSGCSGRAILAHLPGEHAATVIAAHARRKRSWLEHELATIRAVGYAMSFSDNHPHLNGIGAALLDPEDGYPLGAVAIAGPEEQLPEAGLRRLAAPLTAAAAKLGPLLAAVTGPHAWMRFGSLDVTIQHLIRTQVARGET
ncbi:DNA-binding IclR family transcriptional regulator [Amycolatopsis thermophila]|uniref:DNA-binding IclR family transcriptional regulator n=1 Tax=Amycolatopsis thermophila TaxID=206084 RepID=A0ABU0F4I0_9PSEU|nr:DNA-binding IclR family transcriptional regulator [Amycolatopsis thermophila]